MKFLWKLYLGYAAVVLITTALVGVLVARSVQDDALRQIEIDLHTKTHLLADAVTPALRGLSSHDLQDRVKTLGETIDTRLTVIALDGRVLADSFTHPKSMDNHASRPELLAVTPGQLATVTRFSQTMGARVMYVASRVEADGTPVGFVRAALPLTAVDDRVKHVRGKVALGALLAALVALLPGFVFARGFTAPLTNMTHMARTLAQGNYDVTLPHLRANDEIGELSQAFGSMAEQLRARMLNTETDRNKLRAILASMVEGVIAVDRDERVMHMNRIAGEILGSDTENPESRLIYHVTAIPEVTEALRQALDEGISARREVTLPAHPHDRVLALQAAPLRDAAGATVGAVVVIHDVSVLRRLATVRRDFVANVSHELKTPLTAICGSIETLLDDRDMPPQVAREFLGRAHAQSLRLSSLVQDLLALSRVESEEALERTRIDLRSPVLKSANSLRAAAAERGVEFTSVLPGEPVPVIGDEEGLRQAVDNLVNNAINYTPRDGRVSLRVSLDGQQAVIEVQDTGIGIEASELPRIFERFYRVDKARSRELGGTGLGLSIVKHTAQTHGGEVSAESVPGEGSTFRIRLPAAAAERSATLARGVPGNVSSSE